MKIQSISLFAMLLVFSNFSFGTISDSIRSTKVSCRRVFDEMYLTGKSWALEFSASKDVARDYLDNWRGKITNWHKNKKQRKEEVMRVGLANLIQLKEQKKQPQILELPEKSVAEKQVDQPEQPVVREDFLLELYTKNPELAVDIEYYLYLRKQIQIIQNVLSNPPPNSKVDDLKDLLVILKRSLKDVENEYLNYYYFTEFKQLKVLYETHSVDKKLPKALDRLLRLSAQAQSKKPVSFKNPSGSQSGGTTSKDAWWASLRNTSTNQPESKSPRSKTSSKSKSATKIQSATKTKGKTTQSTTKKATNKSQSATKTANKQAKSRSQSAKLKLKANQQETKPVDEGQKTQQLGIHSPF